tara:strand:- start:29 stop:505 length:477 start_codon:yes stop_codon:yes gene_type:complete
MPGRFFSNRDLKLFDKFNKELINNVVSQTCIWYKISAEHTETNMYGESSKGGKVYRPGVQLSALITSDDFDWETDEWGPDSNQSVEFAFHRQSLIDISSTNPVVIEVGDILEWNYAYFEVDTINENQLIGGDVDKNFGVVASTHLTRLSRLNITERQL